MRTPTSCSSVNSPGQRPATAFCQHILCVQNMFVPTPFSTCLPGARPCPYSAHPSPPRTGKRAAHERLRFRHHKHHHCIAPTRNRTRNAAQSSPIPIRSTSCAVQRPGRHVLIDHTHFVTCAPPGCLTLNTSKLRAPNSPDLSSNSKPLIFTAMCSCG